MDTPWWVQYGAEASAVFRGRRVRGIGSGDTRLAERADFGKGCLNSGAGALLMAAHYGAERIIMLGYDCGYGEGGVRHWHGDHPKTLGNAGAVNKWASQFADAGKQLGGVQVINASRVTKLTLWPTLQLEDALK